MACCYCVNNPDWLTCPNCKCSGGSDEPDEEVELFSSDNFNTDDTFYENEVDLDEKKEHNNFLINNKYMEELIELIQEGGLKVYEGNEIYETRLNSPRTSIYLTETRTNYYYARYSLNKSDKTYLEFIERLSRINRVERRFEKEYLPIWTKEDGIIQNDEKFIKIKGKYYTIKFIENLFDKINEFKKINL